MATIDKLFKVQKNSKQINKSKGKSKASGKISAGVKKEEKEEVKPLTELEQLRLFDLDATYGPCTGLTRMERWERAKKFNFDPPQEIKEIIEKHSGDETYTLCIWSDLKI